MAYLTNSDASNYVVVLQEATMRMRNVAEVALVVDNSGSMRYDKYGNNTSVVANQRMTLLKAAATKLVNDMIDVGAKLQTVSQPVQFSVVPFAAAVNVGPQNANASWMDTRGISPIHHEHLNWGAPSPTNPTGYRSTAPDGAKLDENGQPLTRFSVLNALKLRTGGTAQTSRCEVWTNNPSSAGTSPTNSNCRVFNRTGTTEVSITSTDAATATGISQANLQAKYRWTGCVEARPNGNDITDADATGANAFVPWFVPDELNYSQYGSTSMSGGGNNWWPDYETDNDLRTDGYWLWNDNGQMTTNSDPTSNATNTTWQANTARPREVDVAKYFVNKPYTSGTGPTSSYNRTAQFDYFKNDSGPNDGCRIAPITELTDSKTTLANAIDQMSPQNTTNIPEGLAWGWRTISSKAPFTGGVDSSNRGVDKVVIVMTDGANTYNDISAGDGSDMAGNQTANYAYGRTGYAGNAGPGGTATRSTSTNVARLFYGTSASKTTHNSTNFQKAMDDKMLALCENIKAENIILMFVALDMDLANYSLSERPAIQKAIDTMTTCAGKSRTKKNADGTEKKLFWNAKSDNLEDTFREIADELSNLRFAS
jgi:hypothetical protein